MLDLATFARSGRNINRILSDAHAGEVDVHQINCTYFSALGVTTRYIAARDPARQGVPQIYYVGLLAENDHGGRPDRRRSQSTTHDYSVREVEEALRRPVVRRVLELVRLRNTHPAFEGDLCVESDRDGSIRLRWQHEDAQLALEIDVARGRSELIEGGRAES